MEKTIDKKLKIAADRAKTLVESLMPMQEAGEKFPCPRCGRDSMIQPLIVNSLSRYAKVYICNECGTDEAIRDMTGTPLPLAKWSMAQSLMGDDN